MKRLIFLAPLMLAACAEPMIKDSDVIRNAADPAYTYSEGGQIIPSSCLGRASSYSGTASACQRDVAFARQVVNPSDLVAPRPAGPPPAGPVGRAVDSYVNPEPPITSGVPDVPGSAPTGRMLTGQGGAPYDPYAPQMPY
ncbi:hypothetical protein [Paracoccus sediminicola]|uniref:hypothetical protein n=1 Tax=Paracoccus sediminicola TaxID=3017783 RepID=UPI0022F08008|nr:hypothetical protein [Paracoccus sediminicola]WBU57198.1 hypothetical protein PAF18_01755 [Paracoccus sediminicola]